MVLQLAKKYDKIILLKYQRGSSMKNELERLRREQGLKQEELACAMGVSRQTICSIENGKYNPSILLAIKIARYFGKPVEDIFLADDTSSWKTAAILQSFGLHNKNYRENKSIPVPEALLFGQNHEPVASMRYGNFSLSFNGGEIIAVYNAERLLNTNIPLADIILEFEENDMALLGGFAGTDPKKLGAYFTGHNRKFRQYLGDTDFKKELSGHTGVFIYSYWDVKNLLEIKGIHTVAGTCGKDGILIYNLYGDDTTPTHFESYKKFAEGKNFITAYLFP